jgi:hypothetical protein
LPTKSRQRLLSTCVSVEIGVDFEGDAEAHEEVDALDLG